MAADKTKWWQRWGNAAQVSSAAIALLGFAAVLMQLNEIRSNNRATSVRQIYLAYADLEFRNPQFADPDYPRIKAGDRETRTRYESFVAFLLYACEEALTTFSARGEWGISCEAELKVHLPYLCEKIAAEAAFLKSYADTTQAFVSQAMVRNGVGTPDCKLAKVVTQ